MKTLRVLQSRSIEHEQNGVGSSKVDCNAGFECMQSQSASSKTSHWALTQKSSIHCYYCNKKTCKLLLRLVDIFGNEIPRLSSKNHPLPKSHSQMLKKMLRYYLCKNLSNTTHTSHFCRYSSKNFPNIFYWVIGNVKNAVYWFAL